MTTELQGLSVAEPSEDSSTVDQDDLMSLVESLAGTLCGIGGGFLGGFLGAGVGAGLGAGLGYLFRYSVVRMRRLGPLGRLVVIPIASIPQFTMLGAVWLAGWNGSFQSLEDFLSQSGPDGLGTIAMLFIFISPMPFVFAGLWATVRNLGEALRKNGTSSPWAETLVLLIYLALFIRGFRG